MHSSEMEDVESAEAGDVVAVFGVECASMDTFTDGTVNFSMVSMFVPKPVMSLSVKPKDNQMMNQFSKAIGKFTREDPTLRVSVDEKSKEIIMSGMGELHLEVYIERLKREYNVECVTGSPSVAFKETVTQRSNFAYLHKKQSGGSGQFARVIGYVEPLEDELVQKGVEFEFENRGTCKYILDTLLLHFVCTIVSSYQKCSYSESHSILYTDTLCSSYRHQYPSGVHPEL